MKTDYTDAYNVCRSFRYRLPTAREMARYAESRGATGISETAYPGADTTSKELRDEIGRMEAEGYSTVLYIPRGSAKRVIDFYYDSRGFIPPSGQTEKVWTGTRARFAEADKDAKATGDLFRYYVFDHKTGRFLTSDERNADELSVQCATH